MRALWICVCAALVGCSREALKAPALLPGTQSASSMSNSLHRSPAVAGVPTASPPFFRTSGSEVLYSFQGGGDGLYPSGSLTNVAGTLYGTTMGGGGSGCFRSYGCGAIFKTSTSGRETLLYSFAGGSDGEYEVVPNSGGSIRTA